MSSSSKRLGEMIIVSVIVFILFVVGIVYITKNLANINTEKKSLTPAKEEIISDIKDTYKDLNLAYESTNLDDITSLVYIDNDKYKSVIIDNHTGNIKTFNDLINNKDKFALKERELLELKYPAFIVDEINSNKDNKGYKEYYVKDNEVIIYYYDYEASISNISLAINYNEIKDLIKFTPNLDKEYENEEKIIYEKSVALTFDDGPSSKYNPLILETLRQNRATATFFMVGNMMNSCQSCVLETYKSGNEIGSHSWEHMNIKTNNSTKVAESLNKVNNLYHNITGDYIKLLRPPYGSYNSTNLNNINSPFILWNLDTEDWRYRDVDHIVNYIKENVSDGSIILMHELYETSYEALKVILPWLYLNGYNVVSVSELASIKNIPLEAHHAYRQFK